MLKRASNVFLRFQKVSTRTVFKQQNALFALSNVHKCPSFSTFSRYNPKTLSITSITKRNFASLPDHTKLAMPALSPTMEQGNIVKWNFKVGDKVEPGNGICDVETDKATLGFEVQDPGYIAAILVPDGTKGVKVGVPIVILVENEKDVQAFANYKEGSAAPAPQQAAETKPKEEAKPAAAKPAAKNFPSHSKVAMPALSPTMETGKITQWHKKEGDKIDAGDVIANVETDKATVDFNYQDDGYLAKILVQEGKGEVKVGQVVAIVVDDKADVKAFADYSADEAQGASASQGTQSQPSAGAQTVETSKSASTEARSTSSGDRVFASPYAKKTASEQNIDLSQVQGSGPEGRILKHNVDEHVQKGGAKVEAQPTKEAKAPAKAQEAQKFAEGANPYVDTPITNIREIIAKRLLQSKTTVPHYYLETEISMDAAIKIRGVLNESAKTKISFNDLFIKAAALACVDIPEVNSQWHGQFIRKFKNADISVAVDTGSGLITPIVASANSKGLNEISLTTKELIEKAKKNALKPHEFQGGTFSISNLGMLGITNFAAVINPPQSAILAIGKTDKKAVASEGGFKAVNVMNVTLSCDHRVIDGAVGARWLDKFKGYLENPTTMLL